VADVFDLVARRALTTPVVVMTYLNPVLSFGVEDFLSFAGQAGVSGVIVPDLPVDEAGEWLARSERAGVDAVLLAAPGSSDERLRSVASASHGFVYCVAAYGVTGERERLSGTAEELVTRVRPLTDVPLLVGVGIATPEQAAEACRFADGVVVGSALVRHLVAGDRAAALRLATSFRGSMAHA
jgi:tryptophan synthase alpha chain